MSDKIQIIKEKEEKQLKQIDEVRKELEHALLLEQQNLENILKELREKYGELERQMLKETEAAAVNESEKIKKENDQKIQKLLEKKDKEKDNITKDLIKDLIKEQ
ncbi:MAG: hypothetical protein PHV06_12355 [bacterium]|nr:hypothetical protein [bacterium]